MGRVSDDFVERLQAKYNGGWQQEGHAVVEIIKQVEREIAAQFEFLEPLGVGGSGIVATVLDTRLDLKRAIKISRPSPGKVTLLAKVLKSEADKLLRLSHQNLMGVHYRGIVTYDGQDFPYYVMDFIEGACDADDYLRKPGRNRDEVFRMLDDILSAVDYLHSQNTIHMDLKPDNILVTPGGVPLVSDLGFAKHVQAVDGKTIFGGTEGYVHPDLRKLIISQSNDNRLMGEVLRQKVQESGQIWDLYSLGKTFLELLVALEEGNPKCLTPYERRYLRLLACRMLDGTNQDSERAMGLSKSALGELRYCSVRQARTDIQKLTGMYNLESRIPELNMYLQDTIQASTLSTTPFTQRVKEVAGHPVMSRLGNYTQLGLLNLVYPTANHTRLEHSIGTFSVLCRYILALYNDPLNPLFRQIMDEQDLKAALLVGLLHDIGQYPLAHDLEEAHLGFKHEEIGSLILSEDQSLRRLLEKRDGWMVSVERIVQILKASPNEMKGSLKDRILQSLINGPLDADKIDYLMRDSQTLGLQYAKAIDLERLLRCLTIVFRVENDQTYAVLGIHEKGKVPAETIAFVRYAMYGQVYWHHAYRSIKAMIHRMVWEMLDLTRDDGKRVREDFRELVGPRVELHQSVLPISEEMVQHPMRNGCQIHQSDLAMLQWIGGRSGSIGAELLDLLRDRRLYKRVMVLSREKVADKKIWDDMSAFYHKNRRSWKEKLRFQRVFQQRVTALVEQNRESVPETKAITPDIRTSFLMSSSEKALLLVDLPPNKKMSDMPLEYIAEEDRRRSVLDELQTGKLEESVVWNTLQEKFQESIGKLRVFCHPDYADFLRAYLSRDEIETALVGALRELDN